MKNHEHIHPDPTPNTVNSASDEVLPVSMGWTLLPPGDAALTRRVKVTGKHRVVAEKNGRKVFSRGVWPPTATIERIRAELETERSTESCAKRKEADAKRLEKAEEIYVEDFIGAVVTFLDFHPNHADLTQRLAKAAAYSSLSPRTINGAVRGLRPVLKSIGGLGM